MGNTNKILQIPLASISFEVTQLNLYMCRIGPNELSITSANGLREIFGARSKCVKSPFYQCLDGSYPTMLSAGYNGDHERRRKIWDRGFNVKGTFSALLHLAD